MYEHRAIQIMQSWLRKNFSFVSLVLSGNTKVKVSASHVKQVDMGPCQNKPLASMSHGTYSIDVGATSKKHVRNALWDAITFPWRHAM